MQAAAESLSDPTPWWNTTIIGVIAGALIAGLVGIAQAVYTAWAQNNRDSGQRTWERTENRRDERSKACGAFLAAVSTGYQRCITFERDHFGQPPGEETAGDGLPWGTPPDPAIEDALAKLAVLVPEAVFCAAEELRDVHYKRVFGTTSDPGYEAPGSSERDDWASDEDHTAAEKKLRDLVRTLLGNDDSPLDTVKPRG
ncbi:hypothetical protein GCM10025865_27300 [Paraoerskovia sediminicola]|uniref:DUF4129 domain-containing protein n=1 Tax=Paraoerskovia sediminicola TaxID=1138587 RepID=A0ABN6XF29_9CELL|nr:hypothetical protein [Paraoerskovia sediminicola]BDZ43431.1 hypothetical protein GCM10025865_27300 [Paraoerskovia sediminicola]